MTVDDVLQTDFVTHFVTLWKELLTKRENLICCHGDGGDLRSVKQLLQCMNCPAISSRGGSFHTPRHRSEASGSIREPLHPELEMILVGLCPKNQLKDG